MSKLEYRPDVDGLRTIAVLPVVLFHFGLTAFSGGFVGVDVFFVISGYLITRLILHELDEGSFSFARFYERRARRLFPAMFVTVVISMLAAQFLLFPEYLTQAAGSAIFAVTSLSNVFFWTQAGYFDTEALTKPLLHTWSLSVEEQFYLIWPASLVVLAPRFGKAGVLVALAIAGIASLVAAEYIMRSDTSAAFYLTPFRIAEFVIGAAVLWIERFVETRRIVLEILLLAGLTLIFFAVFTYSDATPFPGFSTIIPCLGAALAIAGGRAPFLGIILRNPISVWIGLVSYSIYLIHWPIAVYFDAYFFREPSLMDQIAMVVLTLVLSAAMYRFVEMPFRRPKRARLSASAFGLTCALLALLVILPSSIQWSSRGASDEFASMARDIMSIPAGLLGATPAYAQGASMIPNSALDGIKRGRGALLGPMKCGKEGQLCGTISFTKTNVLVIGDSHAEDAFNAFASTFPENNYLLMRSQGCAPFDEQRAKDCSAVVSRIAETLADLNLDDIGIVVVEVRMTEQRAPLLAQYVRELSGMGLSVVVMGAGPVYERPAPDLYRRLANASTPLPSMDEFRDDSIYDLDELVSAASQDAGATFIDKRAFFCLDQKCSDYTPDGTQLLMADEHHMSWEGANALGQYVRETYPGLLTPR